MAFVGPTEVGPHLEILRPLSEESAGEGDAEFIITLRPQPFDPAPEQHIATRVREVEC
jgi:hypothetical protein